MNTSAVSICFDNYVAEHIAADRLYYQSTMMAKIDKVASALLVLAGVMLVCSVGLRWWTLAPFALAVLEWFNLLSPRPLVRRYRFKQNPKFLETYNLSFDHSGIHFLTKSIDARIDWDHYTKVLENERLWLLVYGKGMYSLIPKRAFIDDNDATRFRELITHRIVSREKSRK